MPTKETRRVLPYEKAERYIRNADVLLFRGSGWISKGIQVFTTSEYSHAGMAGWVEEDSDYPMLMCYEVREFWGGRISPLRYQAEQSGGYIDVYRPSRRHVEWNWHSCDCWAYPMLVHLEPELALHVMRKFANPGEYGYGAVLQSAMLHLPFIRWIYKQPADDLLERKNPPHCAQAVAFALRRAFTDVVRNTPDCFATPGDLARSPLLHYLFTIGPPEGGEEERNGVPVTIPQPVDTPVPDLLGAGDAEGVVELGTANG